MIKKESLSTRDRVVSYYRSALDYLHGPLKGTCHFPFTPPGQKFNLAADLRAMEMLLGETLNLPPGSRVGDGGSGYGRVAKRMRDGFGLHVFGVDLIPERLVEARQFVGLPIRKDSSTNFINGSYTTLPFRNSSLDGFYTMGTLGHADPLEQALSEFRRVLKPGGRIVLFEYTAPEYNSLDPIRKSITDSMIKKTGMTSIVHFAHDAFPRIMKEAKFVNINVRDISKNVWPGWKWLFSRALKEMWVPIITGQIRKKTNIIASLLIWPYRHQLGYKVISANKPA